MYEFKVDVNNDSIEEITYRLTFDERDQPALRGRYCALNRKFVELDRPTPQRAGFSNEVGRCSPT